jgi:hypothetical protein
MAEAAVDGLQLAHRDQMRRGDRHSNISDQVQQGVEITQDRTGRLMLEIAGFEQADLIGVENGYSLVIHDEWRF